ncbi:MAG: PLDc_N domain-containing protein [Bacteroidales bacterium]|nr:PLDc_N domain-containing protein [Bacteroidales bacterium]
MLATILGILVLIADIWCIIDILKKKQDALKKILLIVLVLVFPVLGAILYYFWLRHKV